LTQHQQTKRVCLAKMRADNAGESGYFTAQEGLVFAAIKRKGDDKRTCNDGTLLGRNVHGPSPKKQKESDAYQAFMQRQRHAEQLDEHYETAQEDFEYDDGQFDVDDDDDDDDNFDHDFDEPDDRILLRQHSLLEDFKEYAAYANKNFIPFTKLERHAIKLMVVLRQTKASLDTYESVMEWHLQTTKKLKPGESLKETKDFLTRKKLFAKLAKRYNVSMEKYAQLSRITLPSSRSTANIIWNDAGACIQSLLTDPRIQHKDYLFFGNDPFAPPPANLDYIEDLNTGLSYTETYRRLITKPDKQILLPTPMYIDGAVTGQFANLPITILKMTIGILNRKARDKAYLWRDLGFLPKVSDAKSRGRRIMLESGHVDGLMAHQDVLEGEGVVNNKANNLEDYHAMLAIILDTYVKFQRSNIIFDFVYDGKLYKDTEFILFIPFIKVDNEEADKLVGKFGARSGNVGQICRVCEIPTQFTDRALARYPLKTVQKIKALVEAKNLRALQEMSQHPFKNCWYRCRFGLHNDAGIHGACPTDMLHTILLGIFMRVRDCFFDQIGYTSMTAHDINALSKEYGELLHRHSERDMPKTKFSKGIMAGKIMAKEFEGVLLLMATILRSTKGRQILESAKSGNFNEACQIADWTVVVETLLGWIQWLKSDRMEKKHVKAAKTKHRYLMYLIKKVIRRTKGMGLKILKFHLIQHIVMDILNNGTPNELDTGSNESGHKPTKTAAMLTQKKEDTFDKQTSTRLLEVHLLALATEEMEGRPLWKYFEGYVHYDEATVSIAAPITGGAKFDCNVDEDSQQNSLDMMTRMARADGIYIEQAFVDFVAGLQNKVRRVGIGNIELRTEHKRNGQIFRGHMKYRETVWRDWVEVDWDDDGNLPNKIWGFVDLNMLPEMSGINYGGLASLEPGVYAIVESSAYSTQETEIQRSEIFVPIIKETGVVANGVVTGLKFYLADVEAFVAPLTVIADVGGRPNEYFVVKNRTQWKEDFVDWLESPDKDVHFTMSDDESTDDDYDPDDEGSEVSDDALEVDEETSESSSDDSSTISQAGSAEDDSNN